jgi:hypothetical protein
MNATMTLIVSLILFTFLIKKLSNARHHPPPQAIRRA